MSGAARFARYVALGDSLSLDVYPALDAGDIDVAVALEWDASAGAVAPLGAASLLYANDAARFPEFEGRDLVSLVPGITHLNLATDGATIGEVFGEQLPALAPADERTLVTLTLGGNDLLSAFANKPRPSLLTQIVRDILEAYDVVVAAIHEALPNATLLLTTVYDPSDRLARIPGVLPEAGPLPLQHLDTLNQHIRHLARHTAGAHLADVYAHFLGHGASVAESDRWYWRRSLVEPSLTGASEIRRVWVEALERAGAL